MLKSCLRQQSHKRYNQYLKALKSVKLTTQVDQHFQISWTNTRYSTVTSLKPIQTII